MAGRIKLGTQDVVLRYVDKNPYIETVNEHSAVASKHGSVWIGKIGRGLSVQTVAELKAQCSGKKTYVLLVRRNKDIYEATRVTLLDIGDKLPSNEKDLVPAYYKEENISPFVSLWFKVSEFKAVTPAVLKRVKVASGRDLTEALLKSPASIMFIEQGQLK